MAASRAVAVPSGQSAKAATSTAAATARAIFCPRVSTRLADISGRCVRRWSVARSMPGAAVGGGRELHHPLRRGDDEVGVARRRAQLLDLRRMQQLGGGEAHGPADPHGDDGEPPRELRGQRLGREGRAVVEPRQPPLLGQQRGEALGAQLTRGEQDLPEPRAGAPLLRQRILDRLGRHRTARGEPFPYRHRHDWSLSETPDQSDLLELLLELELDESGLDSVFFSRCFASCESAPEEADFSVSRLRLDVP